MSFEVRFKDLMGRVGRLKTKTGTIETPALLPVVNPRTLEFPPEKLWSIGFKGLTTNAYILWRSRREEALKLGVHRLLNFQGVILTDSGAYQLLQYGDVEVSPLEIAEYQAKIGSDMAVILDVPTGWDALRSKAEWTVKETIRRAKETLEFLDREGLRGKCLWVGPVQGGSHLDLVSYAAGEMAKLPFDVYALGSPTGVMESYQFSLLVEMIVSARVSLPPDKPLHLFGAGHPIVFPFAVALGCDLFDSASYALYARDGRYITEFGTIKLEKLKYLPCTCPACRKLDPKDLAELSEAEKETFLMEHNLYVCLAEVERIKQSIFEGRLWEHLEVRARSHPKLLEAFKTLTKYAEILERYTPKWKSRGLLLFDELSLARPEVRRHRVKMLKGEYGVPEGKRILLLLPEVETKPYSRSKAYMKVREILQELGILKETHVCFYNPFFGVVPVELDDVYPLSQFEAAKPYGEALTRNLSEFLSSFVKSGRYKVVVLHPDPKLLFREAFEGLNLEVSVWADDPWSDEALDALKNVLARLRAT